MVTKEEILKEKNKKKANANYRYINPKAYESFFKSIGYAPVYDSTITSTSNWKSVYASSNPWRY